MKIYKIIVSITGKNAKECISKINEIAEFKLSEVALFLEHLEINDRKQVYDSLKKSNIRSIPLVHLRSDMTKEELKMLFIEYGVKYFTIHEDHFKIINNWKGFYRKLYLEMSTDNYVAPNVKVEQIGGFCVDIAHYKKQSVLNNKDYRYVYDRRKHKKLFGCNHLSGYDPATNQDMHLVQSKKDFLYLRNMPNFIFGELIAFEINNSIKTQLSYKSFIMSLLNKV